MDEEMIEAMARALWELEHGTEGRWPINVENPDDWYAQARAAHSVIAGQVAELDPDVHRRLESVAKTLETCGKHGLPIDFAMLAHDIRAALAQHKGTDR